MKDFFNIAIQHLECGELDEAEDALDTHLKEYPADPNAHNKLGVVFAQRLNLKEAERCFNEALKHDPHFIHALNNLGNIAREEGKLEQAIEYYQKAVSIDKDYALPHNNLGVVYKQLNRYGDFVREMKTAKRLERRKVLFSKERPYIKDWFINLWSRLRK